jgi:hypothetical protein
MLYIPSEVRMLSIRSLALTFLMLATVSSYVPAQTTPTPVPPAATPSSRTPDLSAPADYSTPVEAAKTYIRATFGDSAPKMRDALIISSGHEADVDAFLNLMANSRKLQAAARKEFGATGVIAFESPGPSLTDQLKALDAAKVHASGDTATLTLPKPAPQANSSTEEPKPIKLRKVGSDWKADAAALFDLDAAPAPLADRTSLAKKVTTIAQEVTKDIEAHKFRTATDAYQEFWARCQSLAPATAPAPTAETRP